MDRITKIINLLENGRQKEAFTEYEQILTAGTREEKFLLSEAMYQLGFLDEAAKLVNDLLELYPNEGELLTFLAEIYVELGKGEEAILLLEKMDESDPSYPRGLLILADLYQMEGLYEVSEQKLLQAKSILPDERLIDFALGELYLEEGRFSEAIRYYKKVREHSEEIGGTNINQRLGDAYSAGGAFEQALPYYEQALDRQLTSDTLFQYAFTAYQAGLNATAIHKFEELKELDPDYSPLYYYLAKAYEREEELEKCYDVLLEGMGYDEFNKELFYYAGKIALKLGKEGEAETFIIKALELDPEYIEAGILLNQFYLHHEKYEEVLRNVDNFYESGLEEPRFLWDEAIALQHLEKYSEALNKYERAYHYFKEDIEFLNDYGYFLIEEGKREAAAEIFSRLLEKDPSNEEYIQLVESLTLD